MHYDRCVEKLDIGPNCCTKFYKYARSTIILCSYNVYYVAIMVHVYDSNTAQKPELTNLGNLLTNLAQNFMRDI